MAAKERETLILDAAERVLLAKGLPGTTMAVVAREAGMSKRTLYATFDSRVALFSALVRRVRASVVSSLDPAQQTLPLAARLRLALAPDRRPGAGSAAFELLRAAVAEAPRHSELAETVLEEGPRAVRRLIAAELDRAVAEGEITLVDTGAAAAVLADMALPCPFDKLLSPGPSEDDRDVLRARLDLAIEIFMHGAAADRA